VPTPVVSVWTLSPSLASNASRYGALYVVKQIMTEVYLHVYLLKWGCELCTGMNTSIAPQKEMNIQGKKFLLKCAGIRFLDLTKCSSAAAAAASVTGQIGEPCERD
jgi:hypothetical protein